VSDIAGIVFAEFTEGQPVEFLRTGTFIDMHGQEVEITDEVLDALVANFEAGAAGQDVPIDVDHWKGEAAGWVTKIWRDGDRLLANVDWNEVGERMVGEKLYRYLSATFDTVNRVLRSISLVNFPAVKGLRPVELSEGIVAIGLQEGLLDRLLTAVRGVFAELVSTSGDGDGGVDAGEHGSDSDDDEGGSLMGEEELREQVRQEILTELAEEQRTRAELREQVRGEVETELREELAHRQSLVTFAEEICGGEAGLSTDPDELVELMAGMDEAALATFQDVLRAKVVAFGEMGSSRGGSAGLKALDAEFAEQLRAWVAGGQSVDEWFALNGSDVGGQMAEFDLSEFEGES